MKHTFKALLATTVLSMPAIFGADTALNDAAAPETSADGVVVSFTEESKLLDSIKIWKKWGVDRAYEGRISNFGDLTWSAWNAVKTLLSINTDKSKVAALEVINEIVSRIDFKAGDGVSTAKTVLDHLASIGGDEAIKLSTNCLTRKGMGTKSSVVAIEAMKQLASMHKDVDYAIKRMMEVAKSRIKDDQPFEAFDIAMKLWELLDKIKDNSEDRSEIMLAVINKGNADWSLEVAKFLVREGEIYRDIAIAAFQKVVDQDLRNPKGSYWPSWNASNELIEMGAEAEGIIALNKVANINVSTLDPRVSTEPIRQAKERLEQWALTKTYKVGKTTHIGISVEELVRRSNAKLAAPKGVAVSKKK